MVPWYVSSDARQERSEHRRPAQSERQRRRHASTNGAFRLRGEPWDEVALARDPEVIEGDVEAVECHRG